MTTLELDVRAAFGSFALHAAGEIALAGVTAIFGHSGCGKTTLLRIIAGLEQQSQGRVIFDGDVWQQNDGADSRPAHRRAVGYVFQDARLFDHLSVAGNLDFAIRRARREGPRIERTAVIEALGLAGLLERRPQTLSGGERQRVAIARALLSAPRLVLMDEPLASIDGRRKREILPYIERLPREFGLPVIYVTHAIDEVAALADRIVLMSEGRLVASGPVGEILSRIDLFPLTGRFEAGAVIEARVVTHDARDHLSEVAFDGGRLWIPLTNAAVGEPMRIRIRARDVVIATGGEALLSANNTLAGTITAMREDAGAFVDVQVSCGGTQIISRVTRRSVRRLELGPGRPVLVIIKSITIDGHAGRPAGAIIESTSGGGPTDRP